MRNIPAPRQDLTFAQLKIYYQERGLELNNRFAQSLELLTPDGQYNYIAYLLADENGVSITIFPGKYRQFLKFLVTVWNLHHMAGLYQVRAEKIFSVAAACRETGS